METGVQRVYNELKPGFRLSENDGELPFQTSYEILNLGIRILHWIKLFISRTARSNPTRTAREMML